MNKCDGLASNIRGEGWSVLGQEASRRLQPTELLAFTFAQLLPELRLPRRVAQLVQTVETGSLKVGIAPVGLEGLEEVFRSTASRIGAALIVSALLVPSALMARISHVIEYVGLGCAALLALLMIWRIARTPGGL